VAHHVAVQRALPSGTVTFLFTDVEGSTKLLHDLGADRYAEALADHRRIVREASDRNSGVEVDTQGDAFFLAFPTAVGAVRAAHEIVEGLRPGPIHVRMGLHTGTPLVTDEGYVGADVHFAARVAAAAHGGQVVLSAATAGHLGDEVEVVDLGEHRLKDIGDPVAIFQVGTDAFPPLATISNTNLPHPASSLVGRGQELDGVIELLAGGARLVTLTGPGGSGKTRLAIEAAASLVPDFKAGVFWAGLAPLRDASLVLETVARTVGAKNGRAEHVGEREMLLLLDNFEHVIAAAPEVASVLGACPNLRVLVTSRELLRVTGELEYAVPALAETDAVALFCERARMDPSEEIAELCRRLDNLPLAVELAAARAKALSPAQIVNRLSQRLDLFKGGRDADPRQQTLRATIDWSYDLLSDEDRDVFRRFSVFAGGCSLEAAEEVAEADLDVLQSLVEKSLVRHTGERYWMFETIREYAAERLGEAADPGSLRERHAMYFLSFAERAEEELGGAERGWWLERLEDERDNLRAGLNWARAVGSVEVELRLATALRDFWLARGPAAEGLRRLGQALEDAGELLPERRMAALQAATLIALRTGDGESAEGFALQLLPLAQALGDKDGEVSALIKLSHVTADSGRLVEARSLIERAVAVARESSEGALVARALLNFSDLALREGDAHEAAELAEESLREGGNGLDPRVRGIALLNLAVPLIRLGDRARAVEAAREALELATIGRESSLLSSSLEVLAAAEAANDPLLAGRLLGAAGALAEEVGIELDPEMVSAVRSGLDQDAFESAYAAGAAMLLDDLLDAAHGIRSP
jgi:predicted ATPase/class 3 adenylate cyclase